MVQIARPSSDITVNLFSPTPLYQQIDEVTRSDTDEILSQANQLGLAEVGLSSLTDPGVSTGHIARYTVRRTISNKNYTMVVRLMQGATEIASWTHTNPATTYGTTIEQALTGTQADSITDYTDLRFEFDVTVAAGGGGQMGVSWAEFEVPSSYTTVGGSFTSDAAVLSPQSSSALVDAAIFSSLPGTLTADTVIIAGQAGDFDADAALLRSATEALGADATLRAVLSSSLTSDAALRASIALSTPADAVLLGTQEGGVGSDAVLQAPVEGLSHADAVVEATSAGEALADAVVLSGVSAVWNADAISIGTSAAALEADAVVLSTVSGWKTLDACVEGAVEDAFDVDAFLSLVQGGDFTDDATIRATQGGSFWVDADLYGLQTGQYTLDAVRHVPQVAALQTDAILLAQGQGSVSAEAFVRPYFRVDAVVGSSATTIEGDFGVDATVEAIASGSLTVDAVISGAFTVDAIRLSPRETDVRFTPSTHVNGSAWSRNSCASATADEVTLINYVNSDTASVVSVGTQSGTPVGWRVYFKQIELIGTADHFDVCILNGAYSATTVGSQGLNVAGAYGFMLDIYNNRLRDRVNGSLGSYTSGFAPDTAAWGEWSVEFVQSGSNWYMRLYQGTTLRRTSSTFAAPAMSSWRIAVGARTGGSNGRFRVKGTPYAVYGSGSPYSIGNPGTVDASLWGTVQGSVAVDAIVTMPYFRVDAFILDVVPGARPIDAAIAGFPASSFSVDSYLHQAGTPFTLDAFITGLTADAVITAFFSSSFDLDALMTPWEVMYDLFWVSAYVKHDEGFGSFGVDAALGRSFSASSLLLRSQTHEVYADAYISTPTSGFKRIDAEIVLVGGSFLLWAIIDRRPAWEVFSVGSVLFRRTQASATIDATITYAGFRADAIIGTRTTPSSSFALSSWLSYDEVTQTFSGDEGYGIDAYVDSSWSWTTFSIDAEVVEPERLGSFTAGADISAVGEGRGSFSSDAIVSVEGEDVFVLFCSIAQNTPFRVDAWIRPTFTVDASMVLTSSSSMSVDAYLSAFGLLDAIVLAPVPHVLSLDAVIADGSGDFRGILTDAVIGTTSSGIIEVLSRLVGDFGGTFALDASIRPSFSADAFVQPYFFAGAYIAGTSVVVFPPSQDGGDGVAVLADTFYAPSGEFDSTLVGSSIIIEGVTYTVASVVGAQNLTVSPASLSGTGLDWSIPSGSAVDAVGDTPPPITRQFRVYVGVGGVDVTGDVLWPTAKFTQSARIGPGSFEMSLKGAFSQFSGGEEVHLEVDDFRVFGGYVTSVEYGYAFADDYSIPTTTLRGLDFNVILDRRVIYNKGWVGQDDGGEYKPLRSFAKGTSDRTIITTLLSDYADMGDVDFRTYVDELESPAPVKRWATETGVTIRIVLSEISRITEGVFWIDPYKNLHYHSREVTTAPFPITDGDGGIACRGLVMSRSLSVASNDVFVWGTQAYIEETDSDIIHSRQTADADWDDEFWQDRLDKTQAKIDAIRAIPAGQRTLKQKAELAALKQSKAIYQEKLDLARSTSKGSVERYGRWQYGEFRQDIYEQAYVNRRARAVMKRYSEPVAKGEATLFDPGFQAGQVVQVVSSNYGVADDLAIREMTIDFAVQKEPSGGRYYALPRYRVAFGLDPEEPWDIYQFLPFDIDPITLPPRGPEPNWPIPEEGDGEPEEGTIVQEPLDTLEERPPFPVSEDSEVSLQNSSHATLGYATSSRDEDIYDYRGDPTGSTGPEHRPWMAHVPYFNWEAETAPAYELAPPSFRLGMRWMTPYASSESQDIGIGLPATDGYNELYVGGGKTYPFRMRQSAVDPMTYWSIMNEAYRTSISDGMLSTERYSTESQTSTEDAMIWGSDAYALKYWDTPFGTGIFDVVFRFRTNALGSTPRYNYDGQESGYACGFRVGGEDPGVLIHFRSKNESRSGISVSSRVTDLNALYSGVGFQSPWYISPNFYPFEIVPDEWYWVRYSRTVKYVAWDDYYYLEPTDVGGYVNRAKIWAGGLEDEPGQFQAQTTRYTDPYSKWSGSYGGESAWTWGDEFEDFIFELLPSDVGMRIDIGTVFFTTPHWTGLRGYHPEGAY